MRSRRFSMRTGICARTSRQDVLKSSMTSGAVCSRDEDSFTDCSTAWLGGGLAVAVGMRKGAPATGTSMHLTPRGGTFAMLNGDCPPMGRVFITRETPGRAVELLTAGGPAVEVWPEPLPPAADLLGLGLQHTRRA